MFQFFAATGPHIDIRAQEIFHLGPVPVTNSMMLGVIGMIITLWLLFAAARAVKRGRKGYVSGAVLMIYEMLLRTVEEVVGSKKAARRVAPLAITLFF